LISGPPVLRIEAALAGARSTSALHSLSWFRYEAARASRRLFIAAREASVLYAASAPYVREARDIGRAGIPTRSRSRSTTSKRASQISLPIEPEARTPKLDVGYGFATDRTIKRVRSGPGGLGDGHTGQAMLEASASRPPDEGREPQKRNHLEPSGMPPRCVPSRTRAIGARLGVRRRRARAERAAGASAQEARR